MLTGRSVVVGIIVLVVISLGLSLASLFRPVDRGGVGLDSYGTRPLGFRAAYDVLADLGVPVDRALVPPQSLPAAGTVVLWEPQTGLVSAEPTYVQRLAAWVRRGGRVVLALPAIGDPGEQPAARRRASPIKETTVAAELGLPPQNAAVYELAESAATNDSVDAAQEVGAKYVAHAALRKRPNRSDPWDREEIEERIREAISPELSPVQQVTASAKDWPALAAESMTLMLPKTLQVLKVGENAPAGLLTIPRGTDDPPLVVAARYKLGEGEVVVVADAEIFQNRLLAQEDNAVLAVRLFSPEGKPVLWDEFYQGLTIRGQPLFLLTRAAYAMLACMALLTTALWISREAVFLGPPLAAATAMRRTVAEYIDAMSRFLRRGQGSDRFVVGEMRGGVLAALRKRFNLPLGNESPDRIAAVLARRDPAAARRLLDAVAASDLILSQPTRATPRETLDVLKGLDDCL